MLEKLKEKRYKPLYFLLFLCIFLIVCIYYETDDYKDLETTIEHVVHQTIQFNHDSGVYHDTIQVKLDLDYQIKSSAKIYYTLDGNDPTLNSALYNEPIELKIQQEMKVIPLKVVIYDQEQFSPIYEKDYILDPDHSAYDLPIAIVTCDEDSLNNKETGIFANYSSSGEEWIKNGHFSFFDENGNVLVDQGIGLSVSGGTSVAFDIKSLKLNAGYEYDEAKEKITIDCFTNDLEVSSFSFVSDYNSLKLRSGSQDMFYGNIRSSLVSKLASESNFDGCTYTQRCYVILNGELYGIFDLQQNYSNSYLKHRFGLEGTDVIERIKGNEEMVLNGAKVKQYFYTDLNREENRKKLESVVDMDNYLLYFAINILDNNTDWPLNNVSAWRYTGEPYLSNRYSDGRLRFLIFDTDLIYYTYQNAHFFDGCDQDTFVSLMEGTYRGKDSTFPLVMQSEYYRDKFITIIRDLLNTSFDTDHILQTIDEVYAAVDEPMKKSGIKVYKNADQYIGYLKNAVTLRKTQIESGLAYYFGSYNGYKSTLVCSEGVKVSWNNMNVYGNESYTNDYFTNASITYLAEAYPGYEFDHWEVNGKTFYGESLTVTQDMMQTYTSIKAIATPIKEGKLVISEISAKGDSDWFKFTNVGHEDLNIHNYYISDHSSLLKYFQLPKVTLKPGESIIVNGKNNYYELGNYICNFNLNKEEILYLSLNDEIVDYLDVPDMSELETYGRYLNSNEYRYFKNNQSQRKVSEY